MRQSAVAWLGLLAGAALAVFLALETGPGPAIERGALVERVLDEVERGYVRKVDGDELLHDGLDRMLRSLDRNSRYLSPDQVAAFDQETEGYRVGIGVVVGPAEIPEPGDESEGLLPRITLVVSGGPADRAGLREGERLLSANGESLRKQSVEEATRLIKGQEGTSVALEVEDVEGRVRTVVVERRRVEIPSLGEVAIHRPPEGEPVGLVRLLQFQPGSTEEVARAIDALLAAGARSIVLDLRFNGGGILQEAVGVATLFLSGESLVVRTTGRSEEPPGGGIPEVAEKRYSADSRARFAEIPLAVLVDGHSASASEIVAAALRDHERAPLIGEESFGKWTVQDVIPLGKGGRFGKLKITTQDFHPPHGERVRREGDLPHGLVPDVPVTVDEELRQRLYVWWDRRQLERINTPFAVEEAAIPAAAGSLEALPPADPILARTIDLLCRPQQVASLYSRESPAPASTSPDGGSRR